MTEPETIWVDDKKHVTLEAYNELKFENARLRDKITVLETFPKGDK